MSTETERLKRHVNCHLHKLPSHELDVLSVLALKAADIEGMADPASLYIQAAAMELYDKDLSGIRIRLPFRFKKWRKASEERLVDELQGRFQSAFGRDTSFLGVINFQSMKFDEDIFINLMLPATICRNQADLQARLSLVFGTDTMVSDFQVQPITHAVTMKSDKFGFEASGPEGWVLAAAKTANRTRSKLRIKLVNHIKSRQVNFSATGKGMMILEANRLCGQKRNATTFCLEGTVFMSPNVKAMGEALWLELQPGLIGHYADKIAATA